MDLIYKGNFPQQWQLEQTQNDASPNLDLNAFRASMRKLTPVLRSGYPPCAAVSLVVLSPTREGRVCDIQLVIIAMVLSTTPIFSKGTDIFAQCFLHFFIIF